MSTVGKSPSCNSRLVPWSWYSGIMAPLTVGSRFFLSTSQSSGVWDWAPWTPGNSGGLKLDREQNVLVQQSSDPSEHIFGLVLRGQAGPSPTTLNSSQAVRHDCFPSSSSSTGGAVHPSTSPPLPSTAPSTASSPASSSSGAVGQAPSIDGFLASLQPTQRWTARAASFLTIFGEHFTSRPSVTLSGGESECTCNVDSRSDDGNVLCAYLAIEPADVNKTLTLTASSVYGSSDGYSIVFGSGRSEDSASMLLGLPLLTAIALLALGERSY